MSRIQEATTAPSSATYARNTSAANALKNEYYSQAQASSSSSATTVQNTNDLIKTSQSSNPRESISVLSFDQSPVLQK